MFLSLFQVFENSTANLVNNTSKSVLLHLDEQGTHKINCPAHIHVHELTLFPSFAVPAAESGICSLGSRKLKEMKTRKITELKESLELGKKVETETRYFVLLSTVKAHESYHPTSGAAGFVQRVHPKITKINTLVGEGITEVQEVK